MWGAWASSSIAGISALWVQSGGSVNLGTLVIVRCLRVSGDETACYFSTQTGDPPANANDDEYEIRKKINSIWKW